MACAIATIRTNRKNRLTTDLVLVAAILLENIKDYVNLVMQNKGQHRIVFTVKKMDLRGLVSRNGFSNSFPYF